MYGGPSAYQHGHGPPPHGHSQRPPSPFSRRNIAMQDAPRPHAENQYAQRSYMSHHSPPRPGPGIERQRSYMRGSAAPAWMGAGGDRPRSAATSSSADAYNNLSFMSSRSAPPSYASQTQRRPYTAQPSAPSGAPRIPPPRLRPNAMPAWFNRYNAGASAMQRVPRAAPPLGGGRPHSAAQFPAAADALEPEVQSESEEEVFDEMEQLGAVRTDLEGIMAALSPVLALVPDEGATASSGGSQPPQASQEDIMSGMQAVARATAKLKALRLRAAEELPGMADTLEQLQRRLGRAQVREKARADAERQAQEDAQAKRQAQADLRAFAEEHADHVRRKKQRRAANFKAAGAAAGAPGAGSNHQAESDSAASAFDASVPASFQICRAVQVSAARISLASEQQLSGSSSLGLSSIRKTGRTLTPRGLRVQSGSGKSVLDRLQSVCGRSSGATDGAGAAWQRVLLHNRARSFLASLPLAPLAHCAAWRGHAMAQDIRQPHVLQFSEVASSKLQDALVPAMLAPEAALGDGPLAHLLSRWSATMHKTTKLHVDVGVVARASPHLSGLGLDAVLAPTVSLASNWVDACAKLAAMRRAVTRVLDIQHACISGRARSLAAAFCCVGQASRLAMQRREADLKRTPGLATATSDGGTGANDAEFVGLGIGEGGDVAWLGAGDAGSRSTRSRIGSAAAPGAPSTPGVAATQGAPDIHTRHSDAWVHQGGVSDQAAALALLCVGQLLPSWMRRLRQWQQRSGGFEHGWFRELSNIDNVCALPRGTSPEEDIWRVLSSTHPALHEAVPVAADDVYEASTWTAASVLHEQGASRLANSHRRQLAASRGMPQQAFAAAASSLAASRAQVAQAVQTHRNASGMLPGGEAQVQLHGLCRVPDMNATAAASFWCCVREGGAREVMPRAPAAIAEPLSQLCWPDAIPPESTAGRQWTLVQLHGPHRALHHDDSLCEVAWSDSEKIIFFGAFLSNPKRFGLIASFLVNKTASDVINFYYKVKHAASLKARARAVASSMRRRAGPTVWEVVLDAASAIGCHTPKALLALHKNRWLDTMSINQVVSDLAYSATRSRISTLLARLAAQRAVHGIRLPLHISTPSNKKRAVEQSPAPSPMLRLVAACTPQPEEDRASARPSAAASSPASKKARR